jgi:hypothetical protein
VKISGGFLAIIRIVGGLGALVAKINIYLADGTITAAELIELAKEVIELISGKTLDELGLVVKL